MAAAAAYTTQHSVTLKLTSILILHTWHPIQILQGL